MGWLGNALNRIREITGTRSQRRVWKERILDKMYDPVVVNFARDRGIQPRDLLGNPISNPTINDYKAAIMMRAELDVLLAYCENKGIPIRDITDEMDKSRSSIGGDAGNRRRQTRLD